MGNTIILNDTINAISNAKGCIEIIHEKSLLDTFYSIANIVIALANVVLIYFIFRLNKKKNDNDKEKERKLSLLKTLVLDYNMQKFYAFFQDINTTAYSLKENGLTNTRKKEINEKIKDYSSILRHEFIDVFLAIDNSLYDKILIKTDELIDSLTNAIFDDGINLSHPPKYDELISKKISESKTEIIRILFSYTGV